MSDGTLSAQAGEGTSVSSLDLWKEKTGTIFLSREDIERLAESGSHYLIVSLTDDAPHGGARRHQAANAAPSRKKTLMRRTLQAVAVGACIGASTGLSVATTFIVMTHKAPVGVVALIEQAWTMFA